MRLPPLDADPFGRLDQHCFEHHPWPARWIGPAAAIGPASGVWVFANRFELADSQSIRLHVSADQRYELFLDGRRIGRGPERGDLRHWMYESYALNLDAGPHVLAAVITWLDPLSTTPPPEAQITYRPGLLVFCEQIAALSTPSERWRVKPLPAYRFEFARPMNTYFAVGSRIELDAAAHDWRAVLGEGDHWQSPASLLPATLAASVTQSHPQWLLRPAMLPPMRDEPHRTLVARHVDSVGLPDVTPVVAAAHCDADAVVAWQRLFDRGEAVRIAPETSQRVLIDLKQYTCAYTGLELQGGRGAVVQLHWAESLYETGPDLAQSPRDIGPKGDRNAIEGKRFIGYGDRIRCDGRSCRFEPLWWNAGRYIEIVIQTADEPLTITRMEIRSTGYPYAFVGDFQASDARLEKIVPLALHTLAMCSHETSVDCPYYEQLNYAGDTRLQSLVAMTISEDDRLARKNIRLFDWSRDGTGWTSSRYPTGTLQTIPPFGLWWVASVYDYALYRGDPAFVHSVMPGVRAVLERWRLQIDDDGLVRTPMGWNFIDWVPQWYIGSPTSHYGQPCGVLQWKLCYVLGLAARLEEMVNESLLAQRHGNTAAMLAAVAERTYFDPRRGLLADDPGRERFSEHAQVLALLSGQLSASLRPTVAKPLIEPNDELARASIYFCHYTFEALAELGRVDALIARLGPWFDHARLGLTTLLEQPEPSRSDCHAWGAHPVYHFHASVLGIRPAAFGYARVSVRPRLGPLAWAQGACVHPRGRITARFERQGGRLTGQVALPPGVYGVYHDEADASAVTQKLFPGPNVIC